MLGALSDQRRAGRLSTLRCWDSILDKPAQLVEILTERLGGSPVEPGLIRAAVDQFIRVREIQKLGKKPATGELLTWIVGLARRGVTAVELEGVSVARLPLWQALVKDRDDFKRLQEAGA